MTKNKLVNLDSVFPDFIIRNNKNNIILYQDNI